MIVTMMLCKDARDYNDRKIKSPDKIKDLGNMVLQKLQINNAQNGSYAFI